MPLFVAIQKAPIERLVLAILLVERERGRGFAHFVAQIKGVRRIEVLRQFAPLAALPQLFEHGKRVRIVQVQSAADHMNFTPRHVNAVVRVFDIAREPLYFFPDDSTTAGSRSITSRGSKCFGNTRCRIEW